MADESSESDKVTNSVIEQGAERRQARMGGRTKGLALGGYLIGGNRRDKPR